MEDEAREILQAALSAEIVSPVSLAESIHRRFGALGGVELSLPARELIRKPPAFSR